ncbi:MAG: hypothetical protein IJA89_04985, partial [Clostridia bacterium]|nr:hypothetical protein [Clostridia bacterium]
MDKKQLIDIHIKSTTSSVRQLNNALTFYSDSISISRRQLTNGSVRGHFHDCFELEITLDGDANNIINGSSYPIHKNSFYLLSPADIHKLDIVDPVEIISIQFTDLPLSKELLNHLNTAKYPIIGEFSNDQFETILSPLLNLYSDFGRISNEAYRNIYVRS